MIEVHPQPNPSQTPSAKIYEVRPSQPEQLRARGQPEIERNEGSPDRPVLYLIALNSGTIYTSQEHWLERNILHYITAKSDHSMMPLDDVDMNLTVQLNRERGLPFVIKVRKQSP